VEHEHPIPACYDGAWDATAVRVFVLECSAEGMAAVSRRAEAVPGGRPRAGRRVPGCRLTRAFWAPSLATPPTRASATAAQRGTGRRRARARVLRPGRLLHVRLDGGGRQIRRQG